MRVKKNYSEGEQYTIEEGNSPNFYDEDELDDYIDNDMISNAEEGFMIGYLEA